jgi:type IV pilus assembly protein PilV
MRRNLQSGVMMIEALIAILIFSIGILAVVGMQGAAIKNVTDSRSRSEAAFLASELLAQMWVDQNITPAGANTSNVTVNNYDYQGTGGVPPRLGTITPPTGWIGRVVTRLPGAGTPGVLPKVTITNPPATPTNLTPWTSGADVKIELFWQLPEEASLGVPPHRYTITASVRV